MPVQAWLDEVAGLYGPPTGAVEETAERLVALAHDTRDRGVWGGDRALTYWDRLPERIATAVYAGPTLAAWWGRCCAVLGCTQPRNGEDRALLARCLASGDDRAVLAVMRTQAETLCLRVRLAQQARRDASTPDAGPGVETIDLTLEDAWPRPTRL